MKKNPKRNVAIIILENNENCILLVRTKKFLNHWQPIGGGINESEPATNEVIREVYEETGLILNFDDVLEIIRVPYDFGAGIVYCYFGNKIVEDSMLKISYEEILEYKWFTLKEAKFLPKFKATERFINKLIELKKGD